MKIKFITINIWHGGRIWDNLVEFIRFEAPDIMVLQEVYDGHDQASEKRYRTMEEFGKEFGSKLSYNAFGATVLDTAINTPWGNAVFSKFPIKNFKTTFFDLPYGNYDFNIDPDSRLVAEGVLVSDLEINGKTLTVGSWHGVWDSHGRDTVERSIMSKAVVEGLKNKKTVILAGDTNISPDTKAINNIQEKLGLVSVFGNSLQSTFNLKYKTDPGYATAAVDMIFVTSDIKVVSKEMPQVDVSDHNPLVAMLEL